MYNSVRLLILILFFFANSFPQNPGDVIWTKYYGGNGYDEANAVVNAHDSGYVFVGYTNSYGLGKWGNAFIGKTNSHGDSLFTFNFGGPGMDVLADVIQTSDGNYLAVGLSDSPTEFEQAYLVKFNDLGDTLWTKAYGGAGKEIAHRVIETDDNGFIIAAETSSMGSGETDIWIIKTDSNGDTIWTKTYGTSVNDAAYSVCKTSDGSFAITGSINVQSLMVMKIDSSGDSLWMKTFDGDNFEEGTSIIESSNHDFMVLGHTSSYGAGELDIYLLRLHSNGELVFEKTYGSAYYEEGRDIIQLHDNEFIIAGNTTQNSPINLFLDYYIISVDSAGEVNWSKIINTPNTDRCYNLLNNGDGNFLIAGANSLSAGALENAALTLMAGKIQTGINDGAGSQTSYILYEAYPNPFNPSTNIKYTILQAAHVNIKVYDILGKEVAELVNNNMNSGTYTQTFNTAEYNLSSGVYFYTIKAGNFVNTKKMLLIK